jgi:hypothetical protein
MSWRQRNGTKKEGREGMKEGEKENRCLAQGPALEPDLMAFLKLLSVEESINEHHRGLSACDLIPTGEYFQKYSATRFNVPFS